MFTHVLLPDTKERVTIESENVKHFNPLSYRKNQLYKVQIGSCSAMFEYVLCSSIVL